MNCVKYYLKIRCIGEERKIFGWPSKHCEEPNYLAGTGGDRWKQKWLKNTGFSYLSKTEQAVITRPEDILNNPLKSTENKEN